VFVTVPPTVNVVPDIDEAVPEAFEIDGSLLILVPLIEEFPPVIPPAAPPAPTMIV
jgi:hypothetical protein